MTRRDHLKLALLAAGATFTAPLSIMNLAQAQMSQAAAPRTASLGVYRYRLGEFTLTAIQDGGFAGPHLERVVTNAPLTEVQAALSEAFQPTNRFPISFTTLIVETGRHTVAIDTGAGRFFGATAGRLAASLAAAGFDRNRVDVVLLSHLHPDHVSGLRTETGELLFPNAVVHAPQLELDYWLDEATAGRAAEGARPFFRNAMQTLGPIAASIVRMSGEQEVVPGITAIPANGHTPGHTVFQLVSGAEAMLVLGDLANNPALFVRHPDWQPVFDMDRALAAAVRRRWLDRAAADRLLVAGYHFSFPAHGYIRRDGAGHAYVSAFLT